MFKALKWLGGKLYEAGKAVYEKIFPIQEFESDHGIYEFLNVVKVEKDVDIKAEISSFLNIDKKIIEDINQKILAETLIINKYRTTDDLIEEANRKMSGRFVSEFREKYKDTYEREVMKYVHSNPGEVKASDLTSYLEDQYIATEKLDLPISESAEEGAKRFILKLDGPFNGNTCIKEYEDENIYIPSSYNCVYKILMKLYPERIEELKKIKHRKGGISLRTSNNQSGLELPDIYKLGKDGIHFNTKVNKHAINQNFDCKIIVFPTELYNCGHAILLRPLSYNPTFEEISKKIIYESWGDSSTKFDTDNFNKMYSAPRKTCNDDVYLYDFETFGEKIEISVRNGQKITEMLEQVPYAVRITKYGDDSESQSATIIGLDVVEKTLEWIINGKPNGSRVIMYAYNAGKFDTLMYKRSKDIFNVSAIKCGGGYKSLVIKYKDNPLEFHLRDLKDYFTGQHFQAALLSMKAPVLKSVFNIAKYTRKMYDNPIELPAYEVTTDKYKVTIQAVEGEEAGDTILNGIRKIGGSSKVLSFKKVNYTWVEYMTQDTDCLYFLYEKITEYMGIMGFNVRDQYTISACSWKLALKTSLILQKQVRIQQCPNLARFIRSSIYGGRVHVYKRRYNWSDDTKGLISLDVNSLYPYSMTGEFPIGKCLNIEDFNEVRKKRYFYIAEVVLVIPNIRFCKLPYRNENKNLIYNCGELRGVYTSVELEDAAIDGVTIKEFICGVYWEKQAAIFKETIEKLYDMRSKLKKEGNSFESVIKIALNSLYGKQLQQCKEKIVYSDNPTYNVKNKCLGKKPRTRRLINDQYEHIVSEIVDGSENKSYHLAAFILSYSRALVNRYIRMAGEDNVYYTDTDSIYLTNNILLTPGHPLLDFMDNSALGKFKNDYGQGSVIEEAIFLDVKRYLLKFTDGTFKKKFLGCSFAREGSLSNYDAGNNQNEYEKVKTFYEELYRGEKSKAVIQEFWKRSNDSVRIYEDVKYFEVDSTKKGTWTKEGLFFPLNYDYSKPMYQQGNDRHLLCMFEYYKKDGRLENFNINVKKMTALNLPKYNKTLISRPRKDYDPLIPINEQERVVPYPSDFVYSSKNKKVYYNFGGKYYEMSKFGHTNIEVDLTDHETNYIYCSNKDEFTNEFSPVFNDNHIRKIENYVMFYQTGNTRYETEANKCM